LYRLDSDALTHWTLRASAMITGCIILAIAFFLLLEAWPAWREHGGMRFLTDERWAPTATGEPQAFGLMPMLIGSLAATVGAVLLATPLGVMTALCTRFYAPRGLDVLARRSVEILAGIPSVIYGFWGLVTLVPIIRAIEPPGASLLAAILILAIMILPTITLMTDAAIEQIPREQLAHAAALGLSRFAMVRSVILPGARQGMAAGVILQTGRAIGETMAVLMVAGNVVQTPNSVFDAVRTLTANIALELGYARDDHRAVLFVTGVLLVVIVAMLVTGARRLERGHTHG